MLTKEMQRILTPILQKLQHIIQTRNDVSLARFLKWTKVPQPQQEEIAACLSTVMSPPSIILLSSINYYLSLRLCL